MERAAAQGLDSPINRDYADYYCRIWKYDARTSEPSVYLEDDP